MVGLSAEQLGIDEKQGFDLETIKPVEQISQMPEVGTYTQSDMVENNSMFNIIENYMLDRYGIQSVEGKERDEIVENLIKYKKLKITNFGTFTIKISIGYF